MAEETVGAFMGTAMAAVALPIYERVATN